MNAQRLKKFNLKLFVYEVIFILFGYGVVTTYSRLEIIDYLIRAVPEAKLSWSTLFTRFLLEDLLGAGVLLGLYLLVSNLLALNRRLTLTLVIIIQLAFNLGSLLYLHYFRMFELPFAWAHLNHLEGAPELLSSIKSELTADNISAVALLSLFALSWSWIYFKLISLHLQVEHMTHRLSVTPRLAGALALFLILNWMAMSPPLQAAARSESSSLEDEFLQGSGRNMLFHLSLAALHDISNSNQAAATPQRNTLNSGALLNNEPFRFHFDDSSLSDNSTTPRLRFPKQGKKFNIVLYIFEGTYSNYIGQKVNGRALTPNWDRLAKNSINFTSHYSPNPLSINALYTLLTSAYTLPADRWAASDYPAIKIKSLPELLKSEGYATAILHTGYFRYANQIEFLKERNFDLIADEKELRVKPYTETLNWGIDDRALIKPALKFVQAASAPYFLTLLPVTPHHPYDVPEERFRIAPDDNSSYRAKSYSKYLNALYFADHVMGEVISQIEKQPGGEDTIFVVIADHGEAFGQHRRNFNHPFYLYQENIRVPFLIYNRHLFPEAIERNSPSSHIDLLPTICDILKIQTHSEHQGRSLLRAGKKRMFLLQTTWRNDLSGVVDSDWKYIYNRKNGRAELYNLKKDATEEKNLITQHPELARRYSDFVKRRRTHLKHYYERIVGTPIDWNQTLDKESL